jgi:hypothetical protein
MMIDTHMISRNLSTCDINLGSPLLPAPEAGDLANLILIYTIIFKKSQLTLCRSNVKRVQQLVSLNLISNNLLVRLHFIIF